MIHFRASSPRQLSSAKRDLAMEWSDPSDPPGYEWNGGSDPPGYENNSGGDRGEIHQPGYAWNGGSDPPGYEHNTGGGRGEIRPGDWTCPGCNVNVFASRNACFRCHAPKPGTSGRYGGGMNSNVRPGDWTCPGCNVNVFASRNACFRCHMPKPGMDGGYGMGGGYGGMAGVDAPVGDIRPGDWTCPGCNVNVFASRNACFRCHMPRGEGGMDGDVDAPGGDTRTSDWRPGDWTCPGCNANVFASRNACYSCHMPRGDGGMDGGVASVDALAFMFEQTGLGAAKVLDTVEALAPYVAKLLLDKTDIAVRMIRID